MRASERARERACRMRLASQLDVTRAFTGDLCSTNKRVVATVTVADCCECRWCLSQCQSMCKLTRSVWHWIGWRGSVGLEAPPPVGKDVKGGAPHRVHSYNQFQQSHLVRLCIERRANLVAGINKDVAIVREPHSAFNLYNISTRSLTFNTC